ncbi:hypothetical protein FDN13_12105 [Caloramator sp. E03]|uniref:hypothetical protein n=1 Tax=Caloramator sp. E03 TaxID=2576307 RepID=UPI001110ADF7|nr:hypothetical protein [Caloramator sp. E03]QCX34383.1 hypothetical protein FDN13_12105 [Caloramator sp. E03]
MVQYIIPEYIEGRGDCCRIKEDDNERIIYKGMSSALRSLFYERGRSIESIRKRCVKILNQKNLIPIYLGEGEVLIPVKVRESIVKGDGLYGYVNYGFIDRIYDDYIVFKDNSRICVLENKKSINKRFKMASIVEKEFDDLKLPLEFYSMSKEAATKEDIALLLLEIKKIVKKIEA